MRRSEEVTGIGLQSASCILVSLQSGNEEYRPLYSAKSGSNRSLTLPLL